LDNLSLHIEALIFAAEEPIPLSDIKNTICEVMQVDIKTEDVEEAINLVIEKYEQDIFAIEVMQIAEGFTFMTKPQYHSTISYFIKSITTNKLSKAALETLSIIAYTQPASKTDIESIRGVNCDYAVQKLLEKNLAEIVGRSEGPGRPILYGTSDYFMNYFGLKSIHDLPTIKELEVPQNAIGSPEIDF
jgi:segregation and condensation protein B